METDTKEQMVGADAAPVYKYKLSDIVAAMKAKAIDPDCKAVLSCADEEGVGSVYNFENGELGNKFDFCMQIIHLGVPVLMRDCVAGKPRAASVLVEAAFNGDRKGCSNEFLCDLFGAIFSGSKDGEEEAEDEDTAHVAAETPIFSAEAEDGKEGMSHE